MRWAWALVGLAGAALFGALAAVWWHSGETTAAAAAAVVAAVAAVTGPLSSFLTTRADPHSTIDHRLERLATVVRVQWEREANVRQLHDPQPIALRWTAADPRLMDYAEVIAGAGEARAEPAAAGTLEEVIDEFVHLPRRRLVVIGEPGAGKTGVLLLLTLGLIERRTSADPVPVLFSLASWDPARIGFPQWLAKHLSDEYPFVRPREAQAIVEAGRVLPLLDGLDEMPAGAAAAAVEMINGAGLRRPLVVACRTREFARAVYFGDVLTGATVIELEPVRPDEAETYLRLSTPRDDRLGRWEPVFAELRRDPSCPLAAALSTPLMVTLARSVYALNRSADPAELVRRPGREAIEDRLLDALVPALFAGSSRWSAVRAQAWLAFLAAHLHRRRTRDLAWWDLASRGAVSQIARAIGLGLTLGFLAGLRAELALVLDPNTTIGLWGESAGFVLAVGILAGIGAAVTFGLSLIGLGALRRPSRLDPSFLRQLLICVASGVLLALPAGLAFALQGAGGIHSVSAIPTWLLVSLGLAVFFGLPIGLALGLVLGLLRPFEQPPTPAASLASSRLLSIIMLFLASLSLALVFAGVALFAITSLSVFLEVVALGLIAGLPFALGMAAVLPWSAYQFVHLWLAMRGRLPWRLFAFLEDAHERGLLRQVGGVYQFRHARLQDRLASP